MNDASVHTATLHRCIDRFRAGEAAAADELFAAVSARLDRLARRMLAGFPGLRSEVETGDVLQAGLIRLFHSLRAVRPDSTRSFFNFAAVQMRRELLDLARSPRVRRRAAGLAPDNLAADSGRDLDRWAALQEAVERLPADEREVFGLTFYHGWKQAEIAGLLRVIDRQVRRLFAQACLRLKAEVGDLPDP
jgi:RNA polymerase sigma factor (sigma-70 family)